MTLEERIAALELCLSVYDSEVALILQEKDVLQAALDAKQARLDGLNVAAPVIGNLLVSLREELLNQ